MREILFRGKRTDNGEWLEGCLATFKDGDCAIFDPDDEETPLYQVNPETVGQYTGLTDKNGKSIFEGDIIERRGEITVVIWQTTRYVAQKLNNRPMSWFLVREGGAVIGNIYDSPELLKTE